MRHGKQYVYETSTERVDVWYSTDSCEDGGAWNVPQDTMIRLQIVPKKPLLLEDLTFAKTKFSRHKWSHPQDWVTYRNAENGLAIDVIDYGRNTEEVRLIEYFPKSVDRHLACKPTDSPKQNSASDISLY